MKDNEGTRQLSQDIVYTVDANCVGCNKCIRNCPVMGANISYVSNGENKVRVDQEKCIRCGACISVCSHEARRFNDDTRRFFDDLKRGKKISVVVAPAARVNFESHGKLIGFLKASGVNFAYDVSFGADITTWAYLKAIRERKLATVVSQPCPAIVNYVEKYRPDLIPQLAPVHSPTLCTAIYMKRYMNVTDDIAFISPCIGKSDEFTDPNTGGFVSYNVTYGKLHEYLAAANVDLSKYDETPYDDIGCWLGCLYSRPGGLRENVEALVDGAWVRQIEGTHHVYRYLDTYGERVAKKRAVPLLVDALNCADGCNLGTATRKTVSVDDADCAFDELKRRKRDEKSGPFRRHADALFKMFDSKLKLDDFVRAYSNKAVGLGIPNESELETIYSNMHKETEGSRSIDCSACGYQSCADMARAIFNGINTKENCIAFNRQEIARESQSVSEKTRIIDELSAYTDRVLSVLDEVANLNLNVEVDGAFSGDFEKIKNAINRILQTLDATMSEIKLAADQFGVGAEQVSEGSTNLAAGAGEQSSAVQKLSSLIEMMTEKTKLNAANANRARELSSSAKDSAENGNRLMQDMQKSMEEINEASSNITKILKTIDDIAFQTNILALNAAVESARAGKYGKGFAVVADEVRNLAAKCSNAAKESAAFIDETIVKVKSGTAIANTTADALGKIVLQSNEIAAIVEAIAKTSSEQNGGIDDINVNIGHVAHVVQVNSETSQASAATSEELSAQAISLKESVSRFRLRQRTIREPTF